MANNPPTWSDFAGGLPGVRVGLLSLLRAWSGGLDQRGYAMRSRDLPLTLMLTAAFISFLFSVFLWFFVDKDSGLFVGIWVPSILSLAAATRRIS